MRGLAIVLLAGGAAADSTLIERVEPTATPAPTSRADFAVHDVPEARKLLESIRGTS
jgi:hypothetical protein